MSARSFRPRAVWIAIAVLLIGVPPVLAQPSDADYSKLARRISQGDTVFITTQTEGEVRGRLVRIAPEAIIVATEQGERTVAFSDVGWIEKRGDPVWHGALIGAVILGLRHGGGRGCELLARLQQGGARSPGWVSLSARQLAASSTG